MPCLDVEKRSYRFVVLFFNCLLTFGSYFCFDMPSVLQKQLQGNSTCNENNSSCCADCMGMTGSQYNLLYTVYAWMNAIVVIGAGIFIDKCGNRIGAFIFASLCVIGSAIFAAGSMLKGEPSFLAVMLIGRILFGAGNGSLTICQNRITSFWFANKELALAFGATLAFSRFGSVLNFFITDHIYSLVGLVWTLWIGVFLCILGFISAIIVGHLDVHGMRKLGLSERIANDSKKMHISDIRHFTASYWLIIFTIMFFYNGVFAFVADASSFIEDKYHLPENIASYYAGALYDVSMILCPFLGGIIDVFGKRGILCILCAVMTIPVFGLLTFTYVPPLVCTLWFGITYSIAASSMWPSIPLVVAQATVGTAMGLATSVQMIGIGTSNLIVGEILGKNTDLPEEETLLRWKYVMIYLLANILCCVATSFALNVHNKKTGGILNLSRKEMRKQVEENREASEPLLDSAAAD